MFTPCAQYEPITGASLLTGSIRLYQAYVSPYKGFCCAHRAAYGGPSCSEFARRLAVRRGVVATASLLQRRFDSCAHAARLLAHRRHQLDYQSPATQKWNSARAPDSKCWNAAECTISAPELCGDVLGEGCAEAIIQLALELACGGCHPA